MNKKWLDEFCGSTFWNESLTWNTRRPDFTECFEETTSVWVPSIFLWIFSGLEIHYLVNSKKEAIPLNWFNRTKTCLPIILCILVSIRTLTENLQNGIDDNLKFKDIITPLVAIVTLLLAIIQTEWNRRKGMSASGILFIYWFTSLLFNSLKVYTIINQWNEEIKNKWMDLGYFLILFVEFFLHCFADRSSSNSSGKRCQKACPEEESSFLSRILFSWLTPLTWKGYRRPLRNCDIWSLRDEYRCENVYSMFNKHWLSTQRKTKNKEASVLPSLIKCFGTMNLMASFMKFVQDSLMFVSPIVLRWLIDFVGNDEEIWKGFFYAILLYAACSLQTIFLSQYFYKMFTIGIQVRAALISAIYRKSLKISAFCRKDNTIGEIVNLMSVDTQNFVDILTYLNLIWSSPYQIVVSLYLLWQTLGISVFAGLAMLILLIPINTFIINKVQKFQINQMKYKDERIKVTNEVLGGIKILKLYAWEPFFEDAIRKIRAKELYEMKKAAYMNAGSNFIWTCAPFLVSFVTFVTYVSIDERNVLTASKAFTSLTLFNILRFPMAMLPTLISNIARTTISLRRINKFMNSPEMDKKNVTHEPNEDYALTIKNGNFSWGNQPILRDINIQLKKGSLTALVGHVGAGKSSLISAFLGEMEKNEGQVNTVGSIAYVSQQAWIQNDTIRNNILFGRKYNEKLYSLVVEACALKDDLKLMPGGDLTEIGEKGINLSGGQKQRVNLARAVYAMKDVYLLDDPLSAVDCHVAKYIFENVIGSFGLLQYKTRILSTHNITLIPFTDQILVLKDGRVSERGNYKELVNSKGAFSEFLENHCNIKSEESNNEPDRTTNDAIKIDFSDRFDQDSLTRQSTQIERLNSQQKNVGKLTELETMETGSVNFQVYKNYVLSIGPWLCFFVLFFNLVYQTFTVASSFWLSEWSNDDSAEENSVRNRYILVYGLLGLGQGFSSFLLSFTFAQGFYLSSMKSHQMLLRSCLRALQSFFDTTPIGRILNRFSNDLNCMDNTLPVSVYQGVTTFFVLVGTLFVISYNFPTFLILIVVTATIFFFIQRIYQATCIQLKRMESISRSPIFSFFSETLTGTSTIRAFLQEERFIDSSDKKLNNNQRHFFYGLVVNRWLAVRLESIANLIILFSGLFCVLEKDRLSTGIVGLSVSYALQITQTLNWLVRMICDVETNIIAMERIKDYSELPQEAPWSLTETEPKSDWPQNGRIKFEDYSVRYRPGLDLVLKDINIEIEGGERIGIVGRTGAGKSSLTLCLFRIIESAGGAIFIDDINISNLGLHSLRSKITVIPQDAVLFAGTVRMNLDPFNQYTDEEIWSTLELARLKSFIAGSSNGLDYEVSEGGENFSIGQRQLICLSRALLRKTKLLILDEATAAVDLETDGFIQETIRTQFKTCTVLTIAHRLNTIMDYDRIIVLDKGLIKEMDTPSNLIKENGIFYGMCKEAGVI